MTTTQGWEHCIETWSWPGEMRDRATVSLVTDWGLSAGLWLLEQLNYGKMLTEVRPELSWVVTRCQRRVRV